jgi:drug/metabolite transporter (DMT)-like permease
MVTCCECKFFGIGKVMRPVSNLRRAVPAMLFASLVYAILSAIVKEELGHLSVAGILVWRYLISIVLFIPWMLFQTRGHTINLVPKSYKLYWVRAGAALAGVYLYCEALKNLSIGLASLLFNMLPLFVPLVARVWKKVPINHQLWWGFGVALLGVGFVLSPQNVHWSYDILLAIASGLCAAFSTVSLRFTHYEEPSYRINFYFFLIALVITIPITFLNIDASYRVLSMEDVLPLCAVGVMGLLFQQSYSFALKHAPSRFLSPFMYSAVIWGMIIDRWFWGTLLTPYMWIGTALIIIGNILIYILYPKKDLVN